MRHTSAALRAHETVSFQGGCAEGDAGASKESTCLH